MRPESKTHIDPFKFSSIVKESGIKQQVKEIIFSSSQNTDQTKNINGIEFKLKPVFAGIYHFTAINEITGVRDYITVTDTFVENKVVSRTGKVIEHIWNCPRALKKVNKLLEKHSPNSTKYKQQEMFEF